MKKPSVTEPADLRAPRPRSDTAEGVALHLIDSRRLFYFYHVARLGGLTAAEAFLDIAQSAISRQVRLLEEDLGAQLLERTGRGVSLTEMGTIVYERAEAILGEMKKTFAELEHATRKPRGQIRFAAPSMFIRAFMQQVLERFGRAYPDVRLSVMEASTGQVADLLAAAQVDIAIVLHPPNSPKVETEQLLVEHMDFTVSADDPMAARKSITQQELDGLPFVMPVNPHGARLLMERWCEAGGIALDNRMEMDSMILMKAAVRRLPVYAMLAPGDCYPEDGLVNIPVTPPLTRVSHVAFLRDRADNPFMQPLIRELRRAVKELKPGMLGVAAARARRPSKKQPPE